MNAKKRALGKGLSALLEHADLDIQSGYDVERDLLAAGTIAKVSLDLIDSNPYQPRTDFDEDALLELAASIKEQGVIQPVTVRKGEDGRFQLVSGERRCKASRLAGLTEIPAYIITANDNAMLEMAIVENIQRENLNPIEIALAYKQLILGYDLTQEMLSERLGKSRSSIANYLRLLSLPGEIQVGLRQELISVGHARALISIEEVQTQIEIYNDILAQNLTVRDVEEIVKALSDAKKMDDANPDDAESKKTNAPINEKHFSARKLLSNFYGTRVQIKAKKDGMGSIIINYSSEEDFDRILQLVNPT
ncbi:MAG TPA: chromosome partitioning protein ParB [Bacteroidales bacterium]|nr:chromosome partitioning protein ParB [Bacteroidales bacterium]